MQDLEPFYNWRHIYQSEQMIIPFFGRVYSEFVFSQTIYNTIYTRNGTSLVTYTLCKLLMADYEEQIWSLNDWRMNAH